MIRELRGEHNVIITCRPLANTIELLDLAGFDYTVVGTHYGASKIKKLAGFPIRVWLLYRFLRSKKIDAAISHSSYYSPLAARLAGIPSIYLNDNEYAAGNWVSFLFASIVMIPEYLVETAEKERWRRMARILPYPGIKEGIYLWDYRPVRPHLPELDRDGGAKRIFVRPEPRTAHYYRGRKNFFDELLSQLKARYKVVLLPRDTVQHEYYNQEIFSGITVLEHSVTLGEIMGNCDLFIGAGGTMTREAAVLGIPTISVYQDELLSVDKHLVKRGAMVHNSHPDAEFVAKSLTRKRTREPDGVLLNAGREAYLLIKSTLLRLPKDSDDQA